MHSRNPFEDSVSLTGWPAGGGTASPAGRRRRRRRRPAHCSLALLVHLQVPCARSSLQCAPPWRSPCPAPCRPCEQRAPCSSWPALQLLWPWRTRPAEPWARRCRCCRRRCGPGGEVWRLAPRSAKPPSTALQRKTQTSGGRWERTECSWLPCVHAPYVAGIWVVVSWCCSC